MIIAGFQGLNGFGRMPCLATSGRITRTCISPHGSKIIILIRNHVDYINSTHLEALRGKMSKTVKSLQRALDLKEFHLEGFKIYSTVRFPMTVLYRKTTRLNPHKNHVQKEVYRNL